MNLKNILIALTLIFLASACAGGATITGNPSTNQIPTQTEGTTITGNPPANPLPSPGDNANGDDPSAVTKAMIAETIWKDDSYFAEFVVDGTVNIFPLNVYKQITIKYTVAPDGSILSEHSDEVGTLIGYLDGEDETTTLILKIVSAGNEAIANLIKTESEEDKATLAKIKQCILFGCDQEKTEEIKDNAPGGANFDHPKFPIAKENSGTKTAPSDVNLDNKDVFKYLY
jgi:hypothetical protein